MNNIVQQPIPIYCAILNFDELCTKKWEHSYMKVNRVNFDFMLTFSKKRWQAGSRLYVTAEIRQDKQTSRKLASVWARGMMLKWGRTWSVHSATWIGPVPRLLCKLAVPCICTCEHTNARMHILGTLSCSCLLLAHLMITHKCTQLMQNSVIIA